MNKDSAIKEMNYFGSRGIPFLFIIDFEMTRPKVIRLDELDNSGILFNVNNVKNYSTENRTTKELIFKKYPVSFKDYQNAFSKVIENIARGNSYLLNLTFPTKIETNLTLSEIFHNATAKYKLLYEDEFVLFSPETFVRIEKGKIFSYPMKGTISAEVENASEVILSDQKEMAEHTTIVDLIRNDLSIVAENVAVDKFRYIETVETHEKTLLQVSSEISGTLPDNYKEEIGEIIFKLLPAGSISGAPKEKTVEIIKQVEIAPRNYYTGVFGIFDGNKLDSAVMIRFIEKNNDQLYFKSGGGITFMSDPAMEYQELIDKVYVPIIRNN